MPIKPVEPRKTLIKGEIKWLVTVPKALRGAEGQKRFVFTVLAKAKAKAQALEADRVGRSSGLLELSPSDQGLVMESLRIAGDASNLLNVVSEWARRVPAASVSIGEAITACIETKRKAGHSARYLSRIEYELGKLKQGAADRLVSSFTTGELNQWLAGLPTAQETKRSLLQSATMLFGFCVDHGWLTSNPAEKVQKPKASNDAPIILTVEQVRAILTACRSVDAGLMRYFSLCLFAGLRPSEARQITADDIRADHVEVKSSKSKTRSRRLVSISPTLRAWLALGGDFQPVNWRRRFREVTKAAGWVEKKGEEEISTWPQDCMRHSFVSYSLPIHGSARTAQEAGHSEAVLFQHYRELVTREEAEAFWAVLPKTAQSA